ncbi:hypothetical protein [Kineococcus indalonis]|uniref:hypothetical protein n=1 Tax=Kineococcus indalonis TaxID=2696566 RepID=UPI001411BCC1|nr:hypothetical protein [Kineococcus indalonis]NAZ85050.1 hypothetical protein [Kineococcus indalonis]
MDPRLAAGAFLVALTVCAVSGAEVPAVLTAVATGALVLVLGAVALAAWGVRTRDTAAAAVLAAACGTGVLMVLGLLLNTVLPVVGVQRPLAPLPVALGVDAAVLAGWWVGRRNWPRRLAVPAGADLATAAALALLPLAAAAGAVALDNDRAPYLTVAVLLVGVVLLGVVAVRAAALPRSTVALVLYAVALSLLLMTSVRGTTITGHDIQVENLVMRMALEGERWDASALRSAYNACLSITVLPAVLVALFHVEAVQVFKVVFQALFALCPVAVWLIAERVLGRRRAPLAAVFFVAFPTFFSDMPMLNRQEVAFLLIAAALLLVVVPVGGGRRRRQALLVALGIATVLAHYSSTYVMLAMYATAAAAALVLRRGPLSRPLGRVPTGERWRAALRRGPRPLVTLPVVVLLAAVAYVWTGPATGGDSAGSLGSVAGRVVAALSGQAPDAASADTSVSLFQVKSQTDQERLQAYLEEAVEQRDPGRPYYAQDVVAAYPITVAREQAAPPTGVGTALEAVGVEPFTLNKVARQGFAQALQVLVIIGLAVLVLRRRPGPQHAEFTLLAVGGFCLVASFVVLPFLAVDYGLLRAFQQCLFVLGVPAVLGAEALVAAAGSLARRFLPPVRRRARAVPQAAPTGTGAHRVVCAVPLLLFVSSTGLLATATGGYLPQLHLANAGNNYDSFYSPLTERVSARWLVGQEGFRSPTGVNAQADLWIVAKTYSQTGVQMNAGVVPAQVPTDSYVLLGRTNVLLGTAKGGLSNQAVTFHLPREFFRETKNLVHSTGDTEVYR